MNGIWKRRKTWVGFGIQWVSGLRWGINYENTGSYGRIMVGSIGVLLI